MDGGREGSLCAARVASLATGRVPLTAAWPAARGLSTTQMCCGGRGAVAQGQGTRPLVPAPPGTLPIYLSMKLECWPGFNSDDWQSWDFHQETSFPKRKQMHLVKLLPTFIHGYPVPWSMSQRLEEEVGAAGC